MSNEYMLLKALRDVMLHIDSTTEMYGTDVLDTKGFPEALVELGKWGYSKDLFPTLKEISEYYEKQ